MDLNEKRIEINSVDRALAELFEKRMEIIKDIFLIKQKSGASTFDPKREQQMFIDNAKLIKNKGLVEYYNQFLSTCLKVSKDYQNKLKSEK